MNAGKGDDYRPVNYEKYKSTLNSIFGKKCPKCNCFMSKINNKLICDNNLCNCEITEKTL